MTGKARLAAALALSGVMLWQPQSVMAGAMRGCTLWATAVLPGLLPFMICVLYAAGRLRPGGGRSRWLLGAMGWLTGSPGGARLVAEGWQRGVLTQGAAARLAVCTGVMSPMFVLGTLNSWVGVPGGGWRLLAAHWLGVLGAGWMLHFVPEKETSLPPPPASETPPLTLAQAIREACQAMIAIAGCMALGCALADLFRALLPGLPPWAAAVAQCLLEVTAGCRALLAAGCPPWCLAGAVSLGGLSLWLQCLTCYPAGLPLGRIALGRGVACGLSLLAGWLLWPREAATFAAGNVAEPSPAGLMVFLLLTAWSVHPPSFFKRKACHRRFIGI